MPRRSKTSPLEDLIEIVSRMPWWVGVFVAVVGYGACHAYTTRPIVLAPGARPSEIYAPTVLHGLAMAGQYLLLIAGLVGAAFSAYKRRQRAVLITRVDRPDAARAIDGLSWQEFERLVGEAYRRRGYQVEELGGNGADGGIDLILTRPAQNGREKVLVQCKQWRAYRVGVDVIRELYGVMAARGATAGVVVTSGTFTDEATAFATGRNVTLLNGPKLIELIRPVQQTWQSASPTRDDAFNCPICSKAMVRRVAKHGPKAGSAFWGCRDFPQCRGTRPIG